MVAWTRAPARAGPGLLSVAGTRTQPATVNRGFPGPKAPHSRCSCYREGPAGPQVDTTVTEEEVTDPTSFDDSNKSDLPSSSDLLCTEPCAEPSGLGLGLDREEKAWPGKSDMYIVRSDGNSCSRELVMGNGKLEFAYPSSYQRLLVWRAKPKSVMVIKKLGDELLPNLCQVVEYLGKVEGLQVVVEPDVYLEHTELSGREYVHSYTKDEQGALGSYVDFVVCLGGDGVILHAASLFSHHLPPVISFNLGSLGFLTSHDFSNHNTDLHGVIHGASELESCSWEDGDGTTLGVNVSLRMRLECQVIRAGEEVPEPKKYEVLNEVVLDRGADPYLAAIEVYEAQRFVTTVQADGLMLATPTGSSAYSVAAGGSLVHPLVPGILFTPICPHTLSFRPIILPDYAKIELRVPADARCTATCSFDGKKGVVLERGDALRVSMSPNPVPMINKIDQTYDWIDSLQRCFNWNDRMQQKAL